MGKKKAVPSKSQDPQRRKDPIFIKNVGRALESELYKRRTVPAATGDESPKKAGSDLDKLRKELRSLIPSLDTEGLSFLIEQARVHLYNMKVTELEATRAVARSARNSDVATSGFSIHAAPGGSSYHLVFNGKWKFFSGEEMLAMVRVANAQGDTTVGAKALYQWLKRERIDFLQDLSIRDPSGVLMLELTALIRKNFRIKS